MNLNDRIRRRWPKDWPLQLLAPASWAGQRPTYRDAQPAIIDAALQRSQRRATGNWYVFADSRSVRADRPFGTQVAGVEIVAWRDQNDELRVGPRSAPPGRRFGHRHPALRRPHLPVARIDHRR